MAMAIVEEVLRVECEMAIATNTSAAIAKTSSQTVAAL
jgi:hypothetical protein